MKVSIVYFEPDTANGNVGYDISLTDTVAEVDAVYRIIKTNTGETTNKDEIIRTVKFNDLLDVTGEIIVDIVKVSGD